MKTSQNHQCPTNRAGSIPVSEPNGRRLPRVALALLGVLAFAAGQFCARAQSHQVFAQPARLTVQSGVAGTITTTIYVINSTTTNSINLAVGTLPAWVTSATLDKTSFSDQISSATLTVQYGATVPQDGVSEIPIYASGAYTYRLPVPIHSADIWAGNTNHVAWSDPANWKGGSVPMATSDVVFPSSGASDNGTNTVTNVLVTANQEVAGLRFSNGDSADDQNYGFVILPGATLSVTGSNGFSFLQDTVDLPGDMEVDFFGGGGLVVNNTNANIAMLKGFGQNSTWNMAGLSRFAADVNRIGLGDYTLYPDYSTNGYSVHGGADTNSMPNRFVPHVTLAQTNFIRATFVGTNYDNPSNRIYSMTISKTARQATGSGVQFSFYLGRSNAFDMDSIVFGASGAKAEDPTQIGFSTDTNLIPTNVMPVVYFRGADGTNRMSVFTVADATGPGGSGSGTKATVNLNGGYVNALVDRLYLGRDRQESEDNDTAQAELSIAHGIFDVNTAVVSSQELGNNTIPTDQQGNDPSGEVLGTLNVSTSAVFKVNGTLYIGYTTADPGDKRNAESGNGDVNISDGGVVMANTVNVGGVTKVSVNNRISVTGGGVLIVTNGIGEPDKWLNTLTMSDSTLGIFVDGSKTTPYVYATNVVTSGAGNTIKVESVANVSSYPAQLPIIGYGSASPNFAVVLPSGLYGYVVNNTANHTIDIVIENTAPANLVWSGSPGVDWNTSSGNWQGGLTFGDGDAAQFDDSASNPNVNVPGTVYVGGSGVLITNDLLSYVFGGSGMIGGTSPMNKWGTGTLTMNAASQLPLIIHQGSVNGSGAIGATTVGTNASLTFSGNVNRLTTAGDSVLNATASVANTATVQGGGTLTNMGTINVGLTVESNGNMTVTPEGMVTVATPGNSAVEAGGNLVLNGTWQNGLLNGEPGTYRIDVFGTLTGTGQILGGASDLGATEPPERSRLSIGSGGVLSPGDAPGDIVTFTNLGRFDFVAGSKIIMDVDMDSPDGSNPFGDARNGSANAKRSDVLYMYRWSTMLGTLEIRDVGSQPFTNGTVLKLFKKPYDEYGSEYGFGNYPLNTGQLPVMDPPSPGLGLIWNLSQFRTNGVITIGKTATNPIPLTVTMFDGTNVTFSWPTNHEGWELQTQVNPLNVGLSNNWTVVAGSTITNQITITNWVNSGKVQAQFYRLAHPRYWLQQ